MTSKKRALRATAAALSVATLTILSAPGFATASTSNTPTPVTKATAQDVTADLADMPEKSGLVIHKRTPVTKGTAPAATGLEVQEDLKEKGSLPVNGVTFTVYRVQGIDLKTNAGWETANDLVDKWNALPRSDKETKTELVAEIDGKEQTFGLTEVKKGVTSGEGMLVFDNVNDVDNRLPAGLYVVRESIPSGSKITVDDETEARPAGSIITASPFVVALPLTDPTNRDDWLPTVHVYPKNSFSGITKSVTNADTPGTGNENSEVDQQKKQSIATYTIDGNIPSGYVAPGTAKDGATELQNFQLVDKFDSRVNYMKTNSVVLKSTDPDQVLPDIEPADYTLSYSTGNGDYASGKKHVPVVVVTLTETGLTKAANAQVEAAKKGKQVSLSWELEATFTAIDDVANLPNTAVVIPDFPNKPGTDYNGNKPFDPTPPDGTDPDNPPVPEIPGDYPEAEVISKYGKVTIKKFPKGKEGTPLVATFQLWVCDKDSKVTFGPVSVNGENTWTTTGGTAEIVGLRANDWKNGSSAETGYIQPDERDFYCLEEIVAPENYELDPEYIRFQILSGENDTVAESVEVKVPNVPKNAGFNLPLTGGKGVFPLIALGGLLVVGSAGYAAAAARRNKNQA